ncbi:hypothetical protein ACKVMT_15040 [Halobacteriales archaeon Cl-PHB]
MSEMTHKPTPDGVQSDELTTSQRYRVLADDRRRATIEVLAERAEPMDLVDLAATVRSRDDGGETTDQRIEASLHHRHLPLLDDLGLVEHDAEANRVRPDPAALRRI